MTHCSYPECTCPQGISSGSCHIGLPPGDYTPRPKRDSIHHPKGGMCAHCQHFDKDCSHLDFSKMPVILQDDERVIVRCVGFERVKTCC